VRFFFFFFFFVFFRGNFITNSWDQHSKLVRTCKEKKCHHTDPRGRRGLVNLTFLKRQGASPDERSWCWGPASLAALQLVQGAGGTAEEPSFRMPSYDV